MFGALTEEEREDKFLPLTDSDSGSEDDPTDIENWLMEMSQRTTRWNRWRKVGKSKASRRQEARALKTDSTSDGDSVGGTRCSSCPGCGGLAAPTGALIEVSVDSLSGLSEEADEWEEIEFMVDSGAGTTVIGPEHVRAVQASEPDPTANYKLADGSIIHNQGRKSFVAATEDWEMKSMKAAVTKVETPLLSVSAVVLAGGTVVFSPSGSYIEAKGGHKTPLTASKGVYNLKMWVPKNQGQPFPGQA